MELVTGQVAVVTGAGSGIGLALAERFAAAGLRIVLADVQEDALEQATARIAGRGVEAYAVSTDVSKDADIQQLASQTIERFGAVHVVCNNAGVAGHGDPWFGPIEAWEWVMRVNFWGVVHGCRAFLPHLLGGGHIVNTASMAGLMPGFGPSYDASKHAVVALSEDLLHMVRMTGLPVGVSVLCPGWVRTQIIDSDRNWPADLGARPADDPSRRVFEPYVRRALDEGAQPALIADAVADAVRDDRFWVIPQPEFLELAVRRWEAIGEGVDPTPPEQVPGMPPRSQIVGEVLAALAQSPDGTT